MRGQTTLRYCGLCLVCLASLFVTAWYWNKVHGLFTDVEELKEAVRQLQDKQYDGGIAVPRDQP